MRRKKPKKWSRRRYPTHDGNILWFRIKAADGTLRPLYKPVLGDYIRVIMGMPRDNTWRRIMDTRNVRKALRQQRVGYIRKYFDKLGYSDRVQVIWVPSGLMARWIK